MLTDDAEELGALVEQRSVGGVEIFRTTGVGVGAIWMPAANKAQNLVGEDDRENDPLAEPVNETAGVGRVATPAAIISCPATPRLRR
jgi:hypothetical protein